MQVGDFMLNMMMSRGGQPDEYADMLFGTVLSTKPLKIQLSEKIVLTDSFLILGKHVTDHKESIIIDGMTKEVTIKQALKSDDKVAMFRLDGGQKFYILERLV